MNYNYISDFNDFYFLKEYCELAERCSKKNINKTIRCAFLVCEYIAKFIYFAHNNKIIDVAVSQIVNDNSFSKLATNDDFEHACEYILKIHSAAYHNVKINDSHLSILLEVIHFIVNFFFIKIGLCTTLYNYNHLSMKVDEEFSTLKLSNSLSHETELIEKYSSAIKNHIELYPVNIPVLDFDKYFLESTFFDSGWNLSLQNKDFHSCTIIEKYSLKNNVIVDYVLFDETGFPLGIIYYTKEKFLPSANALKKIKELALEFKSKYNFVPISYYTNGYSIYFIDWVSNIERKIYNIHGVNVIKNMLDINKKDIKLSPTSINTNIIDRDYQIQAATSVLDTFNSGERSSVLELATGTGKTRIAVALSDVLFKSGLINNVLFLSDRRYLLQQSRKVFKKYFPNISTSLFTCDSIEKKCNSRITFSTYKSILNLLNGDRSKYPIGKFDLIIVDEAHRSIFEKYSFIFKYFDARIIGLTATPKNEIYKNTFSALKVKSGVPDYVYDLDDAINDGFLVGFFLIDKTPIAYHRGFYYHDLSQEDKEKIEQIYAYENLDINDIDKYKYNKFSSNIINEASIDGMLGNVMEEGIFVDENTLGKTIIFAKSHFEGKHILKRFNDLYGAEYGENFCVLIDSSVENHFSLIKKFSDENSEIRIAISIYMLDTGVDIPSVVNLVFFREVKSYTQFLQMIGRGTRLCENLFGDEDKNGFYVFDYFGNCEFFNMTSNSKKYIRQSKKRLSLSAKYYKIQYELLTELLKHEFAIKHKSLIDEILDNLTKAVANLSRDDLIYQSNITVFSKYLNINEWIKCCDTNLVEIQNEVLPYLKATSINKTDMIFNSLLFRLEKNLLKNNNSEKKNKKFISKIRKLANIRLQQPIENLTTEQRNKLLEIIDKDNPIDFTFEECERTRKILSGVFKKTQLKSQQEILRTSVTRNYTEDNHLNIAKEIKDKFPCVLKKISELESVKTHEIEAIENHLKLFFKTNDFLGYLNGKELLPFLISISDISDMVFMKKFGHFLNDLILNDEQLQYCKKVIEYFKVNGCFLMSNLSNLSPFCEVDVSKLFGDKLCYLIKLIKELKIDIVES